jgi:hypothetical protein
MGRSHSSKVKKMLAQAWEKYLVFFIINNQINIGDFIYHKQIF